MSEVYDQYTDTAGNYHFTDVETGHHVIPNTAVGSDMNCQTCKASCVWVGKEQSEHGKCLVGYVPKTNADRIRSMTDEELAAVITDDWCEIVCGGDYVCNDGTCEQHVLKWLKEEAKHEHSN